MNIRVLLAAIVSASVVCWSVPAASAAAPSLTRSAVLQKLNSQIVKFNLLKVATVSAGYHQTLTVAEGATSDASPLYRFFFWHDATFVGEIEGWDARIAAWSPNRITLRFGDVPGTPGGYFISYSWRNGRLTASARPPVQSQPTPVVLSPTLSVSPSVLAVDERAQLTPSGFAGPVTYKPYSSDVFLSGNEVWADAPGYYVIAAISGNEMAFADITVQAPLSTPQPPSPPEQPSSPTVSTTPSSGMTVTTPTVSQGGTLEASVPATSGDVFWWLTDEVTGRQYPLFGSATSSLNETLPGMIPPGNYSLSAQVNVPGLTAATYTAQVTITIGSDISIFPGVTPYDIYNWQNMIPLFRQGIEGQGETIALFELSDVASSDVQQFDLEMGLPPANIVTHTPYGDPGITSAVDEADVDAEWAHAVAPDATIVVYAFSQLTQMFGGLPGATLASLHDGDAALSISYGEPNVNPAHLATDVVFTDAAEQGLAVFASSGDQGQAALVNMDWPSTDADVVSVGGVQYDDQGNPSYWYSGYDQSGELWAGAYGKTLGIAPSWQAALGFGSERMIPDVSDLAWNASLVADGGEGTAEGTSIASPMWAATWALVTELYQQDHGGARLAMPAGHVIYDVASSALLPAFGQSYDARMGFGPPNVTNLAEDIAALP